MSEHVFLIAISLPMWTILIVFGMRYLSAWQTAKARLANDDAYRRISETAVSSQTETARLLASIEAAMIDVRTRLAAVEKVLKDVG